MAIAAALERPGCSELDKFQLQKNRKEDSL